MAEYPNLPTEGADLKREAAKLLEKINKAQKRQSDWEKDAAAAEHAYSAGMKIPGSENNSGKVYDFNIVHSNVETIVPAIYNSTPVPDVRPRFSGESEDPQVKIAKEFGERMERTIETQIDDNRLDKEIESEARDAYLSGRGIVRVRFEADMQAGMALEIDPETGEPVEVETETPTNERLAFEAVSWRDYREGPAKRWEDVPWVAYAHRLPEEEIESWEDEGMVAPQRSAEPDAAVNDDAGDVTVWEVWCKRSKKVKWIREDRSEFINVDDDPLGLPGFFPNPEPVQPITLTGMRAPVCPAKIYRKLADEVDLLTKRIDRITSGLKVRGIVLGSAGDVQRMIELNDWELLPASDKLEQLAQMGGLDSAITWWPIEKAVVVLQALYEARDRAKQSIYEITGISDIVRGASESQETATAQQIKTQWGSLRIQRMQKLIERQVRDLFVMSVDIISRNFRPERIQQLTGLEMNDAMVAMMQQPVLAQYRVDVESDSTIRADLTRAKGEMTEFLGGTGQFFSAMAPVVQSAPEVAGPVTEIYASFARVFRLGKQAEDAIDQMTAMAKQSAGQPRPNPEMEKMKAEMQLKQGEMEMKAQELQQRVMAEGGKLDLERAKVEADVATKQAELDIKRVELQIKEAELELKARELEQRAIDADADRELKREAARKPETEAA